MFWTGGKALELGLVDAIGDLRSSLKSRYGEKAKIRLVEPKKGLFGNRTASGISLAAGFDTDSIAAGLTEGLVSVAEEKVLWSRLGL